MREITHALFWHASGRAIYGLSYGEAAILALAVGAAMLWIARRR